MSYSCERVGELLYATIHGTFRLDEAKLTYQSLVDRCVADAISVMLMDCRALEGEPTTQERYDFGAFVALANEKAAGGETGSLRIALVGRLPLIDPLRFGEVVARNRGAAVKATTELEEAIAWLALDPSVVESLALGRQYVE